MVHALLRADLHRLWQSTFEDYQNPAMPIVSLTIDYPCRETGVLAICCRSTAFGVRETMANAQNPTEMIGLRQ